MPERHEDTRAPTLMIVIWIFTSICLVVVSLRLWLRRLTSNAGLDDVIIAIAMLINLAVAIDATVGVHYGLGRHVDTLDAYQQQKVHVPTILLHSLLLLSFAVPKLSVAALLTRLFSQIPRWQKIVLYGLAIYLIIGCFIVAIFHWTQCSPIAYQWNKSLDGTCWPPNRIADLSLWLGASSATLDLFYAVFPITVVMSLHMERQKKITVSILLGLGIVACAICIYKNTKVLELQESDPTYAPWQLILWTDVEANILIIAASMPTLAVIVKFISEYRDRHGTLVMGNGYDKDITLQGLDSKASSDRDRDPS